MKTPKAKLSKLDVKKLRGIKGGSDYVSSGAGCNPTWSAFCPQPKVKRPK